MTNMNASKNAGNMPVWMSIYKLIRQHIRSRSSGYSMTTLLAFNLTVITKIDAILIQSFNIHDGKFRTYAVKDEKRMFRARKAFLSGEHKRFWVIAAGG